jgi:hypothetical protein
LAVSENSMQGNEPKNPVIVLCETSAYSAALREKKNTTLCVTKVNEVKLKK